MAAVDSPPRARGGRRSRPAAQPPPAVPARRFQPPRWRDRRLVAGVLLVLLSVALAGRFFAAATKTARWVTAARPLPAGHTLVSGDLAWVNARLPASTGGGYFTADPAQLIGRTLMQPVAQGALLPAAAISRAGAHASRVVPVVVKAGRLPVLSAGDHVDIYVLAKGDTGQETRVLEDAEFLGAETLGNGDTSISVRVAPVDAIAAVAASQSERVDVVRVERDGTNSPGDPGPSTAPAYQGG